MQHSTAARALHSDQLFAQREALVTREQAAIQDDEIELRHELEECIEPRR